MYKTNLIIRKVSKYFLFLFTLNSFCFAQNKTPEQTVLTFFEGLNAKDSSVITSLVLPETELHSFKEDSAKGLVISKSTIQKFLESLVNIPKSVQIEERIGHLNISLNGPLCYITMHYSFYINAKPSHCGMNVFELQKHHNKWLISRIIDTRGECP